MKIGLAIVTFEAQAVIERCLESVATQTRLPDQIVIVDNGSRDETVALVAKAGAQLGIPLETMSLGANVGFAAANNRAVERLADCDLVALLNPDAFPEPGWLEAMTAAAIAHPEAGSFATRLMLVGSAGLLDGAGDVFHVSGLVWRDGHREAVDRVPNALKSRPVFAACAAAALYRRTDWLRAGGFDERFFCYAEDVDLGFRLQLLGRGCWYVADAVAHHVGSASSGIDSAFSVYHGYRNLEWTFVKNMPTRLLWRYLPIHLGVIFVEFGWFSRKGRGRAILKAKWDAVWGLKQAIVDRRATQALRVVDADTIGALLNHAPLSERFAVRSRRP